MIDYDLNSELYNQKISLAKKKGLVSDIKKEKDLKYWGNIPIDVTHLKVLYDMYKPGYKFLDLGCGIGNVLEFAKNIGYEVCGVEHNNVFIKELINFQHVICDIEDLDASFYKEWDVIYTYLPFKNGNNKPFEKIVDYSIPGTKFLFPFGDFISNRVMPINGLFSCQKIS